MNLSFLFTPSGAFYRRRIFSPRQQQRGFVLEIVLAVLVALMLASIALFRSVDGSSSVAANIAFKSDANNRAQVAFDQIFSWLNDEGNFQTYVINGTDCPDCNYSSRMLQTNAKGIPDIIAGNVAAFDAKYTKTPPNSALLNNEGMRIRYLIERMCTQDGDAKPQYCTMETPIKNDGSMILRPPAITNRPVLRATVRVDGPRNTVSFIQGTVTP